MTDSGENILPYHHPEDKQFSLVFVTDSEADFETRLRRERDSEHVDVRTHSDIVGGQKRFAVHTDTHRPARSLPDFETESALREWLRTEFDNALPVVQAVYTFFDEARRATRNRGDLLEMYKNIELEKIPTILNRVEWRQSVPTVGAHLLSEFVLMHPMPNTNHRTGIVLLDRYLDSFDERVSIPDTGEPGEWYDWASDFVEDSKRYLTLRRKASVLRYAEQLGYDAVERKNDVFIYFEEFDVQRRDAFQYYEQRHRERTREFVDTILDRANANHLQGVTDDGKRAFVDRL